MNAYRNARTKISHFVARHTFLIRLLVTTILAGLIPILLLSALNIRNKTREDQLRLHQQTAMVSKSIASQLDTCMDMILRVNTHFASDNALTNGAQLANVSAEREFLDTIATLKTALPFTDDVGYYMINSNDQFYTAHGKYQLSIYARTHLRADPAEVQTWISNAEDISFVSWAETGQSSAMVIPLRIYASSTKIAVGVYFFSYNSISNFFASSLPRGYAISELYSPDGTLIYRSPQTVIDSNPHGGGSIFLDHKTNTVYYVSGASSSKGYSCVVYVDQDYLMSDASYYSNIASTYVFMAVVLSIILILLVVTVNYIPIRRLVYKIGSHSSATEKQDEIGMVYDAFMQQEDSARQMKSVIETQRLAMIDYVFEHLLEGKTVPSRDIELIQEHGIHYCIAVASLKEVRDIDAILAQNTLNSSVYAIELYRDGYLVLICRCYDDDIEKMVSNSLEGSRFCLSERTDNLGDLHKLYTRAVCRLTDSETIDSPEMQDDTVLKIVSYVDSHFTETTFSIASTSEYLGISEYSTGKLLRNLYGSNLRRFINEKRISYAKELLITSQYSISEIGQKSGFSATSYFIKVFKDLEGITPTQFRDLIKMQ